MSNTITPIYNFSSKYKFGLVYYDEKGRTNGVITSPAFEVTTPAYAMSDGDLDIPEITFAVRHFPPIWAKTFQWVRTKNLTISKFLYWISESTYKDGDYAYIGIQNLYAQQDQSKKSILGYDFTPGDRVRFLKTATGSVLDGKDYEISEFVNNPEIKGTTRNGYFLKIRLPQIEGTFDFETEAFRYYLLNIYSNAPMVANGLNTFYEFGEGYEVGDAGLATRYHKGGEQDQTPSDSQPAVYAFTKGDVYAKARRMDTGGAVSYGLSGDYQWTDFTLAATFIDDQIGNPTYTTGSSSAATTEGFNIATNDDRWIIKTGAEAYTFTAKGYIKLNVTVLPMDYRVYLEVYPLTVPFRNVVDLIPLQHLTLGEHTIIFSATITVPPNSRLFILGSTRAGLVEMPLGGNHTIEEAEFVLKNINATSQNIVDANFSDVFLSAVNSNGRPLVEDEAGETYNPTMYRWSEAYQAGTNINNISRFYPLNYDECDRAKGDIRRFKVRANLMHVFQSRGCGSIPVFQAILSNADGTTNLMQTDKIVNKIRYYQGEYGMGNQPTSLASSAGADYFADPVRGYHCRLAGDGITPISELYKAQYYMPTVLKKYLDDNVNAAGSRSRILGCYDFMNEDALMVMQATPDTIGEAIAFCEPRNAYTSFYDYDAESIVCAGTVILTWKAGQLYVHDSTLRNTYYGQFYPSLITRVVNVNSNVKKEFTSLGYSGTSPWSSPLINTSIAQISNLLGGDFDWREDMYTAAFWRDTASVGGLIDGDFLKGLWMEMQLQNNQNTYQMLYGLYVNYLISQKNY